MDRFISCDWGTSTFRLRLVNADNLIVLTELYSQHGIAAMHALWKEQAEKDRLTFYCEYLSGQLNILQKQCTDSIDGLVIVISGMASSSIGMREVAYKQIPARMDSSMFETYLVPASETFRHDILLVSGMRSDNDVMRGEETILAGCNMMDSVSQELVILPGTHSKHIVIQQGSIKDIKTFMTGELFDLLCRKSILVSSVEKSEYNKVHESSFAKGVRDAMNDSLLNSIFHVRTNRLFDVISKEENYHYLSGLLIGDELKTLHVANYDIITVVSSGLLSKLYVQALTILGLQNKVKEQDAEMALVKGQAIVFRQYR